MKTLVVGSGGREHALARRLAESRSVSSVVVIPGNAGIARDPLCTVRACDSTIDAMRSAAAEEKPDLILVGPAEPLLDGLADDLREDGFTVVGPSRQAAVIGGSKAAAKDLMVRYGIPTPEYREYSQLDDAIHALEEFEPPLLVKADGLARGMGVSLCHSRESAEIAIDGALRQRRFGSAGDRVILERHLTGASASVTVLVDSSAYLMLPTILDHPQVGERGTGPNTLGMGAVAPNPLIDEALRARIESEIVVPSVKAVRDLAGPAGYRGVLHCVLILTEERPWLLGYKVRFGDPEAQAVLPLIAGDFGVLLLGLARNEMAGAIHASRFSIRPGAACAVVAAVTGYPGPFSAGKPIYDQRARDGESSPGGPHPAVFYHAVEESGENGGLITSGGRVLTASATAATLVIARHSAYARLLQIQFEGMVYRRDIGGEPVLSEVIEEAPVFLPQFAKRGGVLPVVVQDVLSGDVLMLAYVTLEALRVTQETGLATFWSTSRKEIWTKGKTSGDTLAVEEIRVDCDQDALLYRVKINGTGTCHTREADGAPRRRCFYRRLGTGDSLEMDR